MPCFARKSRNEIHAGKKKTHRLSSSCLGSNHQILSARNVACWTTHHGNRWWFHEKKKTLLGNLSLAFASYSFAKKNDDSNLNSFAPFRLRCHQISSDHNGKILVPATSNCPKSPRPFPQRWVGRSAAEHPETRNFGIDPPINRQTLNQWHWQRNFVGK